MVLSRSTTSRTTASSLSAGRDEGSGSSPQRSSRSDVLRIIAEFKKCHPEEDLDGAIVAEIGSGSGIVLREWARAFPKALACYGIDCASEGAGMATYGTFSEGGVVVKMEKRDLRTLSSCNCDVLLCSNAAMNNDLQMTLLGLIAASSDVKYLGIHHGKTHGRHPRLPAHAFLGGFFGHRHVGEYMNPALCGPIKYGDAGQYPFFVYDMAAHRDRFVKSFEAMLKHPASHLNADASCSGHSIRDGLGFNGRSDANFADFLRLSWSSVPLVPLVSLALIKEWTKPAEVVDATSEDDFNARSSSPIAPSGSEWSDAWKQVPIASWNGRMKRSFRDKIDKAMKDVGIAPNVKTSDVNGVSHMHQALSCALRRGLKSMLLRDSVRTRKRKAAAMETECPNAKIRRILSSLSNDEARTILRSIANVPFGVDKTYRMRNANTLTKIEKTNRLWTLRESIVHEKRKRFKQTLVSAGVCAIAADELVLPLTSCAAMRKMFLAMNEDILPNEKAIRNARQAMEAMEDRYGARIYDSVLSPTACDANCNAHNIPRVETSLAIDGIDDDAVRGRSEEAWHFDTRFRIASAIRNNSWATNECAFAIKVTADKATFHDGLGINVYGFQICDERAEIVCGERFFQSEDAQYICGIHCTNAEVLSKGGDSLDDLKKYAPVWIAAIADVQRNGIDVDGIHYDVSVAYGGDLKWLAEASGVKDTPRNMHGYACLCCPRKVMTWGFLDEHGHCLETPRISFAKLDDYRQELDAIESEFGKLLPFERKTSATNKASMKAFIVEAVAAYAPSEPMLRTWFPDCGWSLDSLSGKRVRNKMLEAGIAGMRAYYGVRYNDVLRSELDRTVDEFTPDRIGDILRALGKPRGDIDALKTALLERERVIHANARIEKIASIAEDRLCDIRDKVICVGHGVARLQGTLIDCVLADGCKRRDDADRINSVVSKILRGGSVASIAFNVLVNDKGKHKRSQPLIWQHAQRIIDNPDDLLDLVYRDDAQKREKVAAIFADLRAYCSILKSKRNYTDAQLDDEKMLRYRFGPAGTSLWPDKFPYGQYMHMVLAGHMRDYMVQFKCLYRYSNQGWEGIIRTIKSFYYRCSAKGGASHGNERRQFILLAALKLIQRRECVKSGRANSFMGGTEYDTASAFIAGLKRELKPIEGSNAKRVVSGGIAQRRKTIYKNTKID